MTPAGLVMIFLGGTMIYTALRCGDDGTLAGDCNPFHTLASGFTGSASNLVPRPRGGNDGTLPTKGDGRNPRKKWTARWTARLHPRKKQVTV